MSRTAENLAVNVEIRKQKPDLAPLGRYILAELKRRQGEKEKAAGTDTPDGPDPERMIS